mmetsp:Transcript_1924/g.2954  ORF Transcript_1924/g.2954 Transcript_1924/m.2954 type:complete len:330 (-) Transcript_1924:56-1045(-)
MIPLKIFWCFFLVLTSTLRESSAFISSLLSPSQLFFQLELRRDGRENTPLFASPSDDYIQDDNNDSNFDVEAAKKQLELLLVDDGKSDDSSVPSTEKDFLESLLSSKNKDVDKFYLPPPPPLSAIERDRRDAEIQLLKLLGQGDEASADLWNLWYSERGVSAKTKLETTDSLMGDPEKWKECEQILKELVDEYGIYWVEPLNRLATLYFIQNKFDESYKCCLIILQIKPWHFGALSGIVQVCIGRGDRNGARAWAEKRLPNIVAGSSFPPFEGAENPRRQQWVDEQVGKAEKLLRKAERATKKSFGEPDSYYNQEEESTMNEDDGDAWQ